MKQKNDELPDDWMRHRLSRLPDAPPPGSSFDSERLWGQLRPELQPKPAHRKAWWWLSAACIIAVIAGWLVWSVPTGELKTSSNSQTATYSTETDTLSGVKSNQIEQISKSAPALAETHQQKRQRNTVHSQHLSPPADEVTVHEPLGPAPVAQSTVPPATSIVQTVPVPRKANITAVTPKRRFRVMHENELRAEDEAAPKIYRTDHFVRLGGGPRGEDQRSDNQRSNTAPDNSPPTLVMPLKTH